MSCDGRHSLAPGPALLAVRFAPQRPVPAPS
jgi:hypothetical protein